MLSALPTDELKINSHIILVPLSCFVFDKLMKKEICYAIFIDII